MSRNNLLAAACLVLVGLFVGYIAGSGGRPSLGEIDELIGARIDAAGGADAARIAALDAAIADLGGRMDAVTAQMDAVSVYVKSDTDAIQVLGDRLGGTLSDLGAKIDDSVAAAGKSSLDALQGGFDKVQQGLAALSTATTAAAPSDSPSATSGEAMEPAAAAEGAEAADAAAEEASAAPGATDTATPERTGVPEGNSAGETVVLSEAARVFVSRVDDDAGEALVYIDGVPATLKVGETAPFRVAGEDCRVSLEAIDRGHVSLTGGCGGDLPEAVGVTPGTVSVLADGAVRVFFSGADGQRARIAVNGVATQVVAVGSTVDVESDGKACRVTVTSVDRGHAVFDASCS